MAYEASLLAIVSNGFGASIDSLVLKEYCKEYGLDFLWTFEVSKKILEVLSEK